MEQIRQWLESGRWNDARSALQAAMVNERAADPDLGTLLGLALGGGGDMAGAMAQLHKVAEQCPDEPHPCLDLLPILQAQGRTDEIAPLLLEVLVRRPRTPLVALELARHYRASGKMRDALRWAWHAAGLQPQWGEARRLLAWILADLGDLAGSVTYSRQAVALDPYDAAAWSNLGVALTDLGRHDEGEMAHDRALALAPDQPRIRVNRAVNLLAQGRMREAWADYEWRLRLPGHTGLPMEQLLPDLDRGVDLRGKRVLLTHEDGLGDTIQFARFAPLLAARGAQVLAHAPPPLERLLRSLGSGITILPGSAALPAFDYHCPYTSLPRAFGVTIFNIPATPYLFAEPALVARWQTALPAGGFKVGLVWAGQARPWLEGYGPLDGRRSMRLADLAPLMQRTGVQWVSLQKGVAAEELTEQGWRNDWPQGSGGFSICDPMPQVQDFADTAAIVAQLDAVVTVDTSVAHLAGAMGKTVLLLDRFDTCWRWLRNRNDSPWYDKTRIFRQDHLGDWSGPVAQIAAHLGAINIAYGALHSVC